MLLLGDFGYYYIKPSARYERVCHALVHGMALQSHNAASTSLSATCGVQLACVSTDSCSQWQDIPAFLDIPCLTSPDVVDGKDCHEGRPDCAAGSDPGDMLTLSSSRVKRGSFVVDLQAGSDFASCGTMLLCRTATCSSDVF